MKRLWTALAAVVVLLVVGSAAVVSGFVVPRLSWRPNGWQLNTLDGVLIADVDIRNEGWTPVTLLGAGTSGAGLQLRDAQGPFPVTLGHGDALGVTITYQVAGCGAATGSWPMSAKVDRPWGSMEVDVSPEYIVESTADAVNQRCHR
jgi:hypothetical protein